MSPGPNALRPHTGVLHVRYRVWTNRAGGETEQPPTERSPDDARWRFRAPDLSTVRNSLLRCYQEGETATIDCPSKAQSL
jgi:hypothetical protein